MGLCGKKFVSTNIYIFTKNYLQKIQIVVLSIATEITHLITTLISLQYTEHSMPSQLKYFCQINRHLSLE